LPPPADLHHYTFRLTHRLPFSLLLTKDFRTFENIQNSNYGELVAAVQLIDFVSDMLETTTPVRIEA
jgi:hypothetical protein